ncbi:MAG: tetratricopeptide repeat protein [Bacteroidetes bacterium]|nr:tetratricopeptide repeat protein [Bacteroidota bacterium]
MNYRILIFSLSSFILILGFSACKNKSDVKPNIVTIKQNAVDMFPADSFAIYEKELIKDSLNIEMRIMLANNYYVKKQFDNAIYHLKIVSTLDEKNENALILLGNIYYDIEQSDKAIIYYEKALKLNDKNVNVRCDLATSYLNIKNPEKACSLLKKNIQINYNHAQSHHNLSIAYKQLGKTKEAEEELKIFNKLATAN